MKDTNGNWIGLGRGDESAEVGNLKDYMRSHFASYAGGLSHDNSFDTLTVLVVAEMQQRLVTSGYLREDEFTSGVINLETKYAMGYIDRPPPVLPILFSINGHMGNMFDGPQYFVAHDLEIEGVCHCQPVGYDNVSLPFRNDDGIRAYRKILWADRTPAGHPFGPDVPWAMNIFSQGAMVGCEVWLRDILPPTGDLHWRLPSWRGTLAMGNPYREKNVCAEWIPDKPEPNTEGLNPWRIVGTHPWWKEVSRHGDLYAETESGSAATEHKRAILNAAAWNRWTGTDSLMEQLWELATHLGTEGWAMTQAIIDGVGFLRNPEPHGWYDLNPCKDFMRARLTS